MYMYCVLIWYNWKICFVSHHAVSFRLWQTQLESSFVRLHCATVYIMTLDEDG